MRITYVEKTEGVVKKFEVSKKDLDELVLESRTIKSNSRKNNFYDFDLHAMERVQYEESFLLNGIREFNERANYISFSGKRLKDNKITDEPVNFIVRDLNHITSLRFAYAVHELIKRNVKRYNRLRVNSEARVPNPDTIESYFREKLVEYFR